MLCLEHFKCVNLTAIKDFSSLQLSYIKLIAFQYAVFKDIEDDSRRQQLNKLQKNCQHFPFKPKNFWYGCNLLERRWFEVWLSGLDYRQQSR